MIAVSRMNLADAVAMLDARAGVMMPAHDKDWHTLVQYIREARRELFTKTHPYKEWAYQRTIEIQHLDVLPTDYVRPTRLVARESSAAPATYPWTEARRVDPREWRNITSSVRRPAFVGFSIDNPVYMVWANDDATDTWSTQNVAVWLWPSSMVGKMDYVANFSDANLAEASDPLLVPIEMETLVIDMALMRLLLDSPDQQRAVDLSQRIVETLNSFRVAQAVTLSTEPINAQSLPSPQPVQVGTDAGGRQ